MKLTGFDAIEYAEQHDLPLCKYNDPTEDAREDLSVEQARKIALEDPSLIYLEVAMSQQQISEIECRFGNCQDMDSHYIVSVDGDDSEDEMEAMLLDLRQFLGPNWSCEWAGSGNTDADGCTTEDIHVSLQTEVR